MIVAKMNYCFIAGEFKIKPARFTIFPYIIGDMSVNRIFKDKWANSIIESVFFAGRSILKYPLGFGTVFSRIQTG